MKRRRTIGLSLTVLLVLAVGGLAFVFFSAGGCSSLVTRLSTEDADWAYVKSDWGGIVLGHAELTETELTIPFDFDFDKATQIDSAICVYGVRAVVQGRSILVTVEKCLCSGEGTACPLVIRVPRPPAGTYEILYDDVDAGCPSLGRVRVPD